MPLEPVDFSQQEQARIVAAAHALFMEQGLGSVTLGDVALTARLPEAVVARYFPAGKTALAAAVAERFGDAFRQRLAENQQQSSTAVEEMLYMRRALVTLPYEMRSLFLRELASYYPAGYSQLEAVRQASVLDFMRRNLRRGQAEGLYLPALDAEAEAQQWLHLATEALCTVLDSRALAEAMTVHTNNFLGRVTTPAGAYVVRRLQEAAPYC